MSVSRVSVSRVSVSRVSVSRVSVSRVSVYKGKHSELNPAKKSLQLSPQVVLFPDTSMLGRNHYKLYHRKKNLGCFNLLRVV